MKGTDESLKKVTDIPIENQDRASHIRRRCNRAWLNAMGRGFWEHWSPEDSAFLGGMYATVVILFLEPALWSDGWPTYMIGVQIPDRLALSLLVTLPFNGWLVDRFLSSKTPGEVCLPGWLLGLRWLSACLPLAGLYAISTWRAVLERTMPARKFHAPVLDLSSGRSRIPEGGRWRGLYRSGFFFGWIATGILPLLAWAVWLAQTKVLGPDRRPVIFGACIFLHLVSSLSMARYFRRERQSPILDRWRRSLLSISPILWLLAVPGMVLGFALFLLAKPPLKSLTWLVYASRTSAKRDSLWRELQGGLRQQWERKPWYIQWSRPAGLSRDEGTGSAEAQVIAFRRLKTLLLTLDSAALVVVLPTGAARVALPSLLWTAAGLACLGLILQQIAALSARLLRISLAQRFSRHPYGRYLLLTQAAFLAGLYEAALGTTGQVEQLGLLLCYCGALCVVASVLFLLLPAAASPNGPDMTLWSILFLSLTAWGGLIALDGRADQPSLATLRVLIALTPLWSFGLFFAFGGWLLRPFSWRHILDRTLPRRLRSLLAVMALIAALPLGGLAIPFLIFARHRVLPRYEHLSRP
jgi:hypothetical protein